jgi:adenosine deaminase
MLELLAKKEAIPIEVCPTSNKITLGHAAYAEHPYLSQWIARGYPVSINTDDRGIFNTTLTEELLSVKDALRLDLADIVRIVGKSPW